MLRRTFVSCCAALGLQACSTPAVISGANLKSLGDRAREKRWANEFEPNLVVGDAIELQQSDGHQFKAIWAHKPGQTRAIVLTHGLGVHPDHGLTGILRSELHDAGYATLSIQTPILNPAGLTDAAPYAALMPEASERLRLAVNFVRAKGVQQVFMIGHTMGAWMINEYFARSPQQSIVAWASLGYTGRFGSFGVQRPATFDIYTERGSDWTRTRAPDRIEAAKALNPRSTQLYVLDTDLSFEKKERSTATAIAKYFNEF